MFTRNNPGALAAAFAAVVVMAAAFAALALGTAATPGEDGVPAHAYAYEASTFDGHPELDTDEFGTDIPHCASDDWNSTGLPRCYTQRVTDGAILIIDSTDAVIGTLK